MKYLWTTLLLMILAAPAWATTRYVDITYPASCASPSDTDYDPVTELCGSGSDLIYTTVAGAMSPTVSGDTIYLRAGTYTTRITFTGKSFASTVTIGAYPGDTVTYAPIFSAGTPAMTIVSRVTVQGMILDGVNGPSDDAGTIKGFYLDGVTDVTFTRNTITRFHYNGLYCQNCTNFTVTFNDIHSQETTCGPRWYGIYVHNGTNFTITNNTIHNNPGGGIHAYPGPFNGLSIRENDIYDNTTCSSSPVGGIIVATDSSPSGGNITGVTIARNIIRGNGTNGGGGGGIRMYATGGRTQTATRIISNTIYNNGEGSGTVGFGIAIQSVDTTGTIIKNNIFAANEDGAVSDGGTSTDMTHNACAASESCGSTGKVTIAAITDCTVSTSDFTQKVGSSCLNNGVVITGFGSNGAGPEIGAFEVPVVASAEVGTVDATSLILTFTNNVQSPMLPASGITGITVREDAAPVTVSSCARVGDNQIDCTLASAITTGTTVDWSYSQTGNLTDSALIGGTLNQELLTVTNASVTNNVEGAPSSHVFTQARYEYHALYGTEAAPVMKPDGAASTGAAENVSRMEVMVGGKIRIRFAVTCTDADCPPTGFFLRYSKNSGSYTVVPDAFDADNIAFAGTSPDPGIPTNGTATTDQLSTSGTFVAGAVVLTSNAIPTVDLAQNNKTELEYVIAFDTDATAGDTYDFRIYEQDGTALGAYTVTPRITLVGSSGGSGFSQLDTILEQLGVLADSTERIESLVAKPVHRCAVGYPDSDRVTLVCSGCMSLKTTGTGLNRTVTCLH